MIELWQEGFCDLIPAGIERLLLDKPVSTEDTVMIFSEIHECKEVNDSVQDNSTFTADILKGYKLVNICF